jgi:formate-dependent nitrite reductase membrane component NrfD
MTPADLTFQLDVAHWGWSIAAFLFFVGMAGMGSVAYAFVRRTAVIATIFVSLAVGLLLVVSHLGRWWNLPRTLFLMVRDLELNFGSWMLIGITVLSIHLVLALIALVAHLPFLTKRLPWLAWTERVDASKAFLGAFAFVGFFATVYSGFLITQAVGIPLWNNALIPVLWVISGSIAAIAMLELLYVVGAVDAKVSSFGVRLGMVLDGMKLLAVLGFLHVALSYGSAGARYGATLMTSGDLAWMTWVGVVGVGILVPLAIGAYTLLREKNKALLTVSALSALVGVFFLRATVLLAGTFEPLVL